MSWKRSIPEIYTAGTKYQHDRRIVVSIFKEFIEAIRDRVPYARSNGWGGLVIKILLLLALLYTFANFTQENAEKMLWFMSGGKLHNGG